MSIKGTYFIVLKIYFCVMYKFYVEWLILIIWFFFLKVCVYIWIEINNIRKEVKCIWDMVLRKIIIMFLG